MILTHDELAELTGKTRNGAQQAVLREMAIPFKIRPDGSIVALRAAVEAALGYATPNERSKSPAVRIPQARQLLSGQRR